MATQDYRIVPADESDIHDEPHIVGSRITVRYVHERVGGGDLEPDILADRHGLDVADVYHALAYYHDHPAAMRQIERDRQRVIDTASESAVTGPDELD